MGALECRGGCRQLAADCLIGREPSAALQIEDESVSWRHASLRWTGQLWELQDLGSRNGTFLDGQQLAPGTRAFLRVGGQIRFGHAKDVWAVVDVAPPSTSVVDLATGERIFALDDLIALPRQETPELFISRQASGEWVAELAEHVWEPQALEVLSTGKRQYRFEPCAAVNATVAGASELVTPASVALEFVVSRNEEYVELTLCHAGRRSALRPRAHTYLLLTLARLRLQDQADPALAVSAHGWVYQDRLVRMLASSPTQLAVDIYRARKQFSEAGVMDAAQLIERRGNSHELRIGVTQLAVKALDGNP
jgi:hypothetical protein